MNKKGLVESVSEKAGLDRRQAEAAVAAVVETIVDATKAGDKVSILGFGTFTPTSRAARVGRNPQTGAAVKIAATKGVRFAAGTPFKTALNAKPTGRKAGGAKAAAKKAPAKKASATASSTSKATAAKATAKKAPAKKATAKKAAASSKKK